MPKATEAENFSNLVQHQRILFCSFGKDCYICCALLNPHNRSRPSEAKINKTRMTLLEMNWAQQLLMLGEESRLLIGKMSER